MPNENVKMQNATCNMQKSVLRHWSHDVGLMPRKMAGSRWTIVVGLMLIVCSIYYFGDQRRAVPAAVGTSLSGASVAPTTGCSTLRVATFNIHGGTGRDGRYDLSRTADALKDFDLILLNEVHGPYFWQATGQAEKLANLTGNRWLFAPTEERWWHHQFGNAILSTAEVAWWQRVPLTSGARGHRNLVLMEIGYGGGTVRVVVTHLDRNDPVARTAQLAAASDLFLALAEPAILMGDLNTTADEPQLAGLLTQSDIHDPLQEVLRESAPRHIDWILTRGLKTVDAGLIDNGASDHPLVWAELANDERRMTKE
jgi:endonuclease/exonuclease/phosphatase family metal-dependent hydrolase